LVSRLFRLADRRGRGSAVLRADAIVCLQDMYVERAYSEETAKLLGQCMRVWVTNEFQHSGIR
jgi:hypothetical protein